MESFYTTVSRAAPFPHPERRQRAARIARIKFMALPEETAAETSGPVPRSDLPVAGTRAGALVAFLRRIAFRVIGRPSAARP